MEARPLCFTCGVAPATIREKREPRLAYCQLECQHVLYHSCLQGAIEIGEALSAEDGHLVLIGDDMDALPDEDFEEILLRLPPRGLIAYFKASRRAQTFANDPKFRLRYMKRQKPRIRLIMRMLCGQPDIMLDWMPQALENNIWDPVGTVISFGNIAFNPLEAAAFHDRVTVVGYLLADGRIQPTHRVLHLAILRGHEATVARLLADPRVDPSTNVVNGVNVHIIEAITENASAGILRLLIADGRADPSLSNQQALFIATNNQQVEHVKELLKDPRVVPDDAILGRTVSGQPSLELLDIFLKDGRADPVEAWKLMRLVWMQRGVYRPQFDRSLETRLLEEPAVREYLDKGNR